MQYCEFVVFATYCDMTVTDMYPKKFRNDLGLEVLNGIISIDKDMLIGTIHL